MEQFVNFVNGLIWSQALIWLCLGAGLYFSLRTRFMQVRSFVEMTRLTFTGHKSDAGVSSFQALALSMSGRIGIGNIAGVATAIAFGGPGAVFWMWVMGFLGASTSFIECCLAQIYKEKDNQGRYRGGPAFYIEKGLGLKWYAWVFALATIAAAGFLMPGVQANAIADGAANFCNSTSWCFDLSGRWLGMDAQFAFKLGVGAVVGVLLAAIIFGGLKRIAAVAEFVVPFMAIAYIVTALVLMALNYEFLPTMFRMIFESAFGLHAGFGAIMGLAIEWGVKRGIYANEAGQGTGPHAAAAAEVSHPAKQGYVQAWAIYFDTMLICTSTAFIVLATGMYNVTPPGGEALYEAVPGIAAGAGFVQAGVDSVLPGWGNGFVALALFFFAFTTIMAYYYMAETNLTYVNGHKVRPLATLALRLGLISMVVFGAVRTAEMAWTLGDIGVGLMAWLNIIAIFLLQKPALAALRDYERQKKAGLDPVFDPDALGIRNAGFWRKP